MVQRITTGLGFFFKIREHGCLLAGSVVVLSVWTLIVLLSQRPGATALVWFLAYAFIMLVTTALVLWQYHRRESEIPIKWVFISAILLRLVSLLGEPLFEDDYYRYLWDGYLTATTNDPYTLAPATFFDQDVPEIFEPILSLINYPDVATVYGPVNQWLFALAYRIDAAEIWPLQLMAGVADLLVLGILYYLGAGNALLLYAWSPLLLKEFSLTAHPDIFAILGMMLSVCAVFKQRLALAGCALALAFGAKVFAILVLPFLLTSGSLFRDKVLLVVSFVVTLGIITIAFGDWIIWVPDGLLAMAGSWFFNSPLYLILLPWLEFHTIKLLVLALFTFYVLIAFARRWLAEITVADSANASVKWQQSPAAFSGEWLFVLFLLALPVVNPWYVTWILPFAVLRPRVWLWVASFSVLLSYWYGANILASGPLSEQLPLSVLTIEYLIIILTPLCVFLSKKWIK